ncbi:MAG: Sir2 family NAD-dependent protein deacetylase [Acidobacteriota bacterium]
MEEPAQRSSPGANAMTDAQTLQQLLDASERVVAFTGAGISTESGIPDYRSPGGVWTKYQPILFEDFMSSAEARRETWRRKIGSSLEIGPLDPNEGHLALARLYERGKLGAVITQNIDGLHQDSGIPESKVIELHGNTTYAKCVECDQRFELDDMIDHFEKTGEAPVCPCGGYIKTATISFGQSMPAEPMQRAEYESTHCDLFLVLGTSLVVFPAASFPLIAKEAGARVAIVNREPTELDIYFDLVVHGELGETLTLAIPHAS